MQPDTFRKLFVAAATAKWRRHFPPGGPGPYTVRWVVGDERAGRVLRFQVH